MSDRIIFKNFHCVVPMIKDRWVPLYLEYGHLEVENYSLQWINKTITMSIPVAMISCIILGPGTTVTHAAIVNCSKTNTPIVWMGQDGLYYYACGVNVNEQCKTSILHASLHSVLTSRTVVARRMFKYRFPDIDVSSASIDQLRGFEGNRIRDAYKTLSDKYRIPWSCRNTNGIYGIEVDDLNISLNVLNYHLYCICLSVIVTMGYIPSLGFIHCDGKIPFVYDIADMYKIDLSFDVAFSTFSETRRFNRDVLLERFANAVSDYKLLKKLPNDLKQLMVAI